MGVGSKPEPRPPAVGESPATADPCGESRCAPSFLVKVLIEADGKIMQPK
jgi:hypothetical protein